MTDTPLSDELLARVAKRIHEAMVWAALQTGKPKAWINGNSYAEDEARAAARAALEAARYGELERYLNESRPYLEAFRLKEAGQALMGEIDRMPVRQLCKRADALLSSIGASHDR